MRIESTSVGHKSRDPEEYIDPSKSWRDNEKLVYGELIRELVLEIPPVDGCKVTRVEIEEILKIAHKNQHSKYVKLTDPNAKALYSRRVRCNNRNIEVCV